MCLCIIGSLWTGDHRFISCFPSCSYMETSSLERKLLSSSNSLSQACLFTLFLLHRGIITTPHIIKHLIMAKRKDQQPAPSRITRSQSVAHSSADLGNNKPHEGLPVGQNIDSGSSTIQPQSQPYLRLESKVTAMESQLKELLQRLRSSSRKTPEASQTQ